MDEKLSREKPFSIFINYCYGISMTGLCFIGLNLVFVLVFFLIPLKYQNFGIYFLALIPFGPALTALFSNFNVLIKEKHVWTYPCQVDSFKKTKQPSGVDILSVPGG